MFLTKNFKISTLFIVFIVYLNQAETRLILKNKFKINPENETLLTHKHFRPHLSTHRSELHLSKRSKPIRPTDLYDYNKPVTRYFGVYTQERHKIIQPNYALDNSNHFTDNASDNERRIHELMQELILKSRMVNKSIVERKKKLNKTRDSENENENENSNQQSLKNEIKNSINNAKSSVDTRVSNDIVGQQRINNDMLDQFLDDALANFERQQQSMLVPKNVENYFENAKNNEKNMEQVTEKENSENNANDERRKNISGNQTYTTEHWSDVDCANLNVENHKNIEGNSEKFNKNNLSTTAELKKCFNNIENSKIMEEKRFEKLKLRKSTPSTTIVNEKETNAKILTHNKTQKPSFIKTPIINEKYENITAPLSNKHSIKNNTSQQPSKTHTHSQLVLKTSSKTAVNAGSKLQILQNKAKNNSIPITEMDAYKTKHILEHQPSFKITLKTQPKPNTKLLSRLNTTTQEFSTNNALKNKGTTAIEASIIDLSAADKMVFEGLMQKLMTTEIEPNQLNERTVNANGKGTAKHSNEVIKTNNGNYSKDNTTLQKNATLLKQQATVVSKKPVKVKIVEEIEKNKTAEIENPIKHTPLITIHKEMSKTVNCHTNLDIDNTKNNTTLENDTNTTKEPFAIKIPLEKLIFSNTNVRNTTNTTRTALHEATIHQDNVQLNSTKPRDELQLNKIEVTKHNVNSDTDDVKDKNDDYDDDEEDADDDDVATADDSDEENYDDMDISIETATTTKGPSIIKTTMASIDERNQLLQDIVVVTKDQNKTYSTRKHNYNFNNNENGTNDVRLEMESHDKAVNEKEEVEINNGYKLYNQTDYKKGIKRRDSTSLNPANNETSVKNEREKSELKMKQQSIRTKNDSASIAIQSMSTYSTYDDYNNVESAPSVSLSNRKEQYLITSNSEDEPTTEITATNWWHTLPYAEIRKFLNTIFDRDRAHELYEEIARKSKEIRNGQHIKETIETLINGDSEYVDTHRRSDAWYNTLTDFWDIL